MPVEEFLNTFIFMKPIHSSRALILRSGKAVLCFILAHIHHNHAFGFKAWNECELAPVIEYTAIDILLKVVKRKQHLFIESTDNISTLFCLPVVAIDTRLTNRRVTMRADGLVLKAAFIHIDNRIALLRKAIKLSLIRRSFYWASFWML